MRQARNWMLTLALVLASLIIASGAAPALSTHSEGVLYQARGGQDFSWTLPAGEYNLQFRAGPNGAEVDNTNMGLNDPERVKKLPRGWAFADYFSSDGKQTRSLHMISGDGSLIISRRDFSGTPLRGNAYEREAVGHLNPGECRAFYYITPPGRSGFYRVSGTGDGVGFVLLDHNFGEVLRREASFSQSLDALGATTDQVTIQACHASGSGTRSYAIKLVFPDPNPPASTGSEEDSPFTGKIWLPIGAVVFLLGLALVTALAYRRRRKNRAQRP